MANDKPKSDTQELVDVMVGAMSRGNADLADAIRAAVSDAIKNNRSDVKGLDPAKVAALEAVPTPKRWRRVACKSDETGATFTAVVVESKAHPAGRIVALEGYTHPEGVATYQADGGLVPTGMQIMKAGVGAPVPGQVLAKHDLCIEYMQWRWVEFWQKDIRRYSGKGLTASAAVEAAAFSTQWLEGHSAAAEVA